MDTANDTIARHANGKPILYYTWTPYWVSGALVPGKDVEWLSVPYTSLPDGSTGVTEFEGKNLGFAVDNLRIVARNDFLAANPAAAKLFEVAEIDINDISAENKLIADGEDSSDAIDKHVADWIAANQATYDSWLTSLLTGHRQGRDSFLCLIRNMRVAARATAERKTLGYLS